MTGWQEVQGTDREAALSEAVRILGVAQDDLEIGDLPADGEGVRLIVRRRDESDDVSAADEEIIFEDGSSDDSPELDQALLASQQEVVLDFIEELLESFDLEGEIAAEFNDTVLYVDINGDDLGSLIGRRGSTLAALAEITKTVVQRRTAARVRLHLDVQGYRARRREALEKYAMKLSNDVSRTGVEKALEPMPASERKIVHDAVARVDGVRSYSEGNEPKRNVVIGPS